MASAAPAVLVVSPRKRMGLAIVLAALFGPLGLFYATTHGGLVMLLVCGVVGIGTLGFGLLLTWPTCVLWAGLAVWRHNAKVTPPRLPSA